MNSKIITLCLLSMAFPGPGEARPGPIDEATLKMRQSILSRVHLVEVQRLLPNPAGGYKILAASQLDEARSRDLVAQFRRLPFERVTIAQCHEPGFALRFLDPDKKPIATISLCWKCSNLQAAPDSPEEFREYKEDFAAGSKRGLSFQRRLDTLVPKPPESPDQAMQRTAGCCAARLKDELRIMKPKTLAHASGR